MLVNFCREVTVGNNSRRKIDLVINFNGKKSFYHIELKHWHIGFQRGQNWSCRRQLSAGSNQFEYQSQALNQLGKGYFLIFTTQKPNHDDLSDGMTYINDRLQNLNLRLDCLTDLNEYPEHYFLGLMKVQRLH